ncbi:cellulase family glycosylhydrolase [Actinomycetes bacterium M1A6_2h]
MPLGLSTGSAVLWSNPADVQRTMDAVRDSGATHVRVDVSWTFAQPMRSYYDWAPSDKVIDAAASRGLTVLATITNTPAWASIGRAPVPTTAPEDPTVYGEFAGMVAARYRGKVDAYEIWNEPNGRQYFGPDPDPIRYTAMLVAAYAQIKAADPDAIVVTGGLGNTATLDGLVDANEFVDAMYSAGAHGSFDALSYHPYDFGMPIGNATRYANSPMQQMISMHQAMTAHGDGDKKVWITEYGASTSHVSLDAQASLVVDSYQQWSEVSFAGPFFVYTVRDAASASSNIEDNYGILFDDWSPKPTYDELRSLVDSGVPARASAREFDARAPADLGEPLSPVFPSGTGLARQYENGSFSTSTRGWFESPTSVAAYARTANLIPIGPFQNGYQDMEGANRLRVFFDPRFGTHALVGAILAAWRPELGFPVNDEYSGPDGSRIVDFQNGRISWNQNNGATVLPAK